MRVILRDGRVSEFRVAGDRQEDRVLIRRLFESVSPESLYLRFFHAVREVKDSVIDNMVTDAAGSSLTLLCVTNDQAIGAGTYTLVNEDSAEVAFLVADDVQGKGIGTLLLEHLAEIAWQRGLKRFFAYVLEENRKMMNVFTSSGFQMTRHGEAGLVRLELPLHRTERAWALQEAREKHATAASLDPFLQPRTVAVVGASRDPNRLGHLVFRHIVDGGFQGTVYPVNPVAHSVAAVRAYPSLCAIPERIDLAVVVTPADQVSTVVEDCIQAGVRAVMILSSGFAERDKEGSELQKEIVLRLRNAGCRLVGPNCLGLVSTRPDVRLNASFAPQLPVSGQMAIASQSGALGIAILDYASRSNIGVSSFVSTGNKADISGNDLVQYWEDDPNTNVIALYLESFGNPRKFSRISRRVTRRKPILVVKSARSITAASTLGVDLSLPSTKDAIVDALFRQTGIIRVDTLQELFDTAALLSFQPLPGGRRVALVSNSAGGAVMAVDALLRQGMQLPYPPHDLGPEATSASYRSAIDSLLRDPNVDAVMVIFVPVGLSDETEVSQAVADAVQAVAGEVGWDLQKPVCANFLSRGDFLVRYIDVGERRVPIYPFPEQAVFAIAKAVAYAEYRSRPVGRVLDLEGIDCDKARAMMRSAFARKVSSLDLADVASVLGAVGIRVSGELSELSEENAQLDALQVTVELDPLFGPIIGVRQMESTRDGRTGWLRKAHHPAVVRVAPLTDLDCEEIATAVLEPSQALDGEVRSNQLQEILMRLSRLAEEVPEVSEVSLALLTTASGFQAYYEERSMGLHQTPL